MSWLSNRFSASSEGGHGDDEGSDEFSPQGKGVTDGLSELTKTFTRQLWGVASFLAPPPPPTSIAEEQIDPSPSSSSDRRLQLDPQIDPFSASKELSLSNELVDVDFQASSDPAELLQEDSLQRSPISNQLQTLPDDERLSLHQSSDHGIIGIGKDFAELKGSVATGLSRFLKVVRDEIDRSEHETQLSEDVNDDEEDEDDDHESESPVHAGKLPGFNSLIRPLLSSIIYNEGDVILKRKIADEGLDHEHEGEDGDDPADVHGHRMSQPLVALNLQRRFGESLGGISKFASSLFPATLGSVDERDGANAHHIREEVGVTEEVLVFAETMSMHPETWLDFPSFTDDEEEDDFEMSDAQKEHIHEVELASPRLAALRIELCPDYMTEGRFWKIYFVLLHSRLSKKDAVLLSTPQIMEARAQLLKNVQRKEGITGKDDARNKPEEKGSAQSFKIISLQSATEVPAGDFDRIETREGGSKKFDQATTEMADEVQNKDVLASTVKLSVLNGEEDEEADADKWLLEEASPHLGSSVAAALGDEDDVSFSDLEEDDESFSSKKAGSSKIKGSHNWVDANKTLDQTQGSA